MDAEVKVPLKVIRVWGKIATLRRARKEHKCAASGLPIEKGEDYYCVHIGGASLGDTRLPDRVRSECIPDRVHIECIHDYLNFGGKNANKRSVGH